MLALDLYRDKLNESSCQCPLCTFLQSTELNAKNLRLWASQFKPTFAVHGRQEDAEDFLRVLIDKCLNLSILAHFDTKETKICTVCNRKANLEVEELNRGIKSCPIENEFQYENTADMIKRTLPVNKFCSGCHSMNSEGTGVSHKVIETYTRLPQVHFVSSKRFNADQTKITNRVYPSPILEIDEVTYYLKAVIKHNGGLEGGHYNNAVNMETLWVNCDNSKEIRITDETSSDEYLFFYETSPLNLSIELHESLEAAFAAQRDDFLTSHLANEKIFKL